MSTSALMDEVGEGIPSALSFAVQALQAVDPERVWQMSEAEIGEALGGVGAARHLLEVLEVVLVREGLGRGLPDAASRSAHDWVSDAEGSEAPSPPVGHVAQVVRMARARRGCDEVVDAFVGGDLALSQADKLVRFEDQVRHVADPEMLEADLSILLAAARDDTVCSGPAGQTKRRRGLTERELGAAITRTGRLLRPAKDLEAEDRRAKAARSLHRTGGPAGLVSYRMVLDAEGASVLDAAVAALAAPAPGDDGERDIRPVARRRADALVDIVRRGVSAPGEAPSCEKAQIHVTIPWETLREAVHGGEGDVLGIGRSKRWFTSGQKRTIRWRDGGCTYPGCTIPAQWCDAHHVQWWSRGGGTGVANGALLCAFFSGRGLVAVVHHERHGG